MTGWTRRFSIVAGLLFIALSMMLQPLSAAQAGTSASRPADGDPLTATTDPNYVNGVLQQGSFASFIPATAAGGTPPYTYSSPYSSPPDGLSLDPATGTVSGTPTTPVVNYFGAIRVTDSTSATADQPAARRRARPEHQPDHGRG